MSEHLDRYLMLKRELIRVRDEHRLHGHRTSERECREEDAILDDMDIVWHKMSAEEHKELDGGWDCCCGSLNYMAREIAKWSEGKGWVTNWRNVPEKLMLVVTELAEAMESLKHRGILPEFTTYGDGIHADPLQLRRIILDKASVFGVTLILWRAEPQEDSPGRSSFAILGMFRPCRRQVSPPKNNDGRTTCFWCGGPTKRVFGIATDIYDICTKCGK